MILDGFEVNLSNEIKDKTGNPPKITRGNQYLVWKYLKNPNETNWPRELKLANQLLVYCDLDFWADLDLDFKLNSLAFFLTEDGKRKLRIEYRKKNCDLTPETERQK